MGNGQYYYVEKRKESLLLGQLGNIYFYKSIIYNY